jgi:hypothetical protein
MLVPPQQKEYLYLKPVSFWILIKLIEKRVVLDIFQQDLSVEPLCKLERKACLAYAKRTFYDNVVMWIADVDSPLCPRYMSLRFPGKPGGNDAFFY